MLDALRPSRAGAPPAGAHSGSDVAGAAAAVERSGADAGDAPAASGVHVSILSRMDVDGDAADAGAGFVSSSAPAVLLPLASSADEYDAPAAVANAVSQGDLA